MQMYYNLIILGQTSKFKFMGMLFFSVFSQDAKKFFISFKIVLNFSKFKVSSSLQNDQM